MMSIKEVTKITGLSASALRYYESEGLLPYVKRGENGNRIYDQEDLEWIHFTTALRATGMPITQIQEYVNLFKEGDRTISIRKKMMLTHKSEIEKKIKELYYNLDKINYKLALYDVLEAQMDHKTIKI
ncbi:MerR family transcriptional regulator [Paenibacillus sp. OAS669]|uniref:MerR family transcriptional regulator n=1 Tax=Paenibacillus sp. OAS669 TaxID=2663821 RepID=UPI001789ED00|nr:MerR family transcriptional regulator [Paenibacillus sp. OAS669]MBE1446241.1 DNA-binding transcriptional MerR regulator [Paenibacillus sp. OAS669]